VSAHRGGKCHEALSILTRSAADIVLLDFNMPGRIGLELLAELRTTETALSAKTHSSER
jgi:CheY-like chemotaxis protein